MAPIEAFRCSSVLRRIFLLLCMLTASIVLRAQIVSVPTTGGGLSVAVNPVTNKIYIPSRVTGLNVVNVIDGATNTTKAVNVGTRPSWAAVNPVTNKIYVTDVGASTSSPGTVIIIDGTNDTVTTTLPVGTSPSAVAVNPVTNKVYVVNNGSASVTVIDGATSTVEQTLTVGTNPYAVAVNPVTNKIYVANSASSTMTVIDGATNATTLVAVGSGPVGIAVNPVTNKIYVIRSDGNMTVVHGADNSIETSTVHVGSVPAMVAVNPVTNKIYVINFADSPNNILTVIDGATDSVTNSLTMGGTYPYTLAVNSVTNKIYVANFDLTGSAGNDSSVTVVDGASNATTTVPAVGNGSNVVIVAVNPVTNRVYTSIPGATTVIDGNSNATLTVNAGTNPLAVDVNPVTNMVYVANISSNTVTVVDGATNTTQTVGVGDQPQAVAANPVTNKVYVANYNSGDVTVINGTNNSTQTVHVGTFPYAVAVNPVTNKVYVPDIGPTTGAPGTVIVIDGTSDTVTTTLPVGISPVAVAVNPVTNKIYVANLGSNTVTVIDGATNSPQTVNVGTNPVAFAVNTVTNKIYVLNNVGNNVTVIDGASNSTQTVNVGATPRAIAVNPVTNKVYVTNNGDSTVTVIDGTNDTVLGSPVTVGTGPNDVEVNPVTSRVYVTNTGGGTVTVIDGATSSTQTVSAGTSPLPAAVNPVTNKIYVANFGGSSVTVIDADGHQTVPLTTTIAGVSDSLTVSTTNVFQTANRTPSFTVSVNSAFSSTPANNPPPTQVYYQVDGSNPSNLATMTSSTGANPASFTVNLSQPEQLGPHTLYVYAAYGNEGDHNGSTNGNGDSPETGNLTAYLFLVVPVSTTTTLTADVNPQLLGQPVILTAQVATPAPTGGPTLTGTVTFSEGTTVLGTGTANSAGIATFTTSSLSLGAHTITATYSGDANYGSSTSGPLTVTIVASLPTTIELVGGSNQSAVYATAFAQPLVVVVKNSDGTPVVGANVAFAGSGLTFSSNGVATTDSNGMASVTATGTHVGTFQATAMTAGVSQTVTFALTVTPATLTVTANNASRAFGAANPTFAATITGFVNGEGPSVVSGTPSFTTTATASSPVGTYPITATQGTLAAANYTFTFVNGALTVTKAALTVTANNASRVFGAANPAFTATITGFIDGDTAAVISGAPSFTTTATASSPVGTYPITVTQGTLAAANYTFTTFVNGMLAVTKATGSVSLTVSPNPAVAGSQVTLTATVPAGATGTVTFSDGTTTLGTTTISGNTATLVTSTLTAGSHNIMAVYNGDTNFASAATSAPINLVINAGPDFSLSSSTPPQIIPPGASASFVIHIPSVGPSFTSVVTLTASGLPAGATYTFNPPTVTPGPNGANTTLTVNVPKQSAMFHRTLRTPLVLAVLLLPLPLLRRMRRRPPRLLLWWLLALTSFGVIAGCGSGGYFNQPQQTYIITVTGTSGSVVHSTTVTLTVQ